MDTKPHAELPPLDHGEDWRYNPPAIHHLQQRERQLLAALQSIAALTARAEKAEDALARFRALGGE